MTHGIQNMFAALDDVNRDLISAYLGILYGYRVNRSLVSKCLKATYVVDDVFLTEIVDFGSGLHTSGSTATNDETEKPFALFGRSSWQRSKFEVVWKWSILIRTRHPMI